MQSFTVFDIQKAEVNLEPVECIFCDSDEVVYIQSVKDAVCECCGKWQIEESDDV